MPTPEWKTPGTSQDRDRAQRLLAQTSDLSSLSAELGAGITDPQLEALLSPSTANVVRGLRFSPGDRILVVNAGAGSLARHLAEQCNAVDAVVAHHGDAALARLRLADLPGATVHLGGVHDLPSTARYDAVLWIAGGGSLSRAEFDATLSGCAARLAAGGHLVVIADNPLGLRYLAGHADERTGRPFDAPEGFLFEPAIHLPTRHEVETAMAAHGLATQAFAVAAEHRHAGAVISHEAFAELPGLAAELRRAVARAPGSVDAMDERGLWLRLVSAGVAFDFADAFVILGRRGGAPALWNPRLLAVHFTPRRKPELMTRVDFERDAEGVVVRRTLLADPARRELEVSADLRWQGGEERFVMGDRLLSVLWDVADPLPLLRDWAGFLRAQPGQLLDINPGNVMVTKAGLAMFDQEWYYAPRTVDMKLRYGLMDTAFTRALARRRPPDAGATLREITARWATEVGTTFTEAEAEELTADDTRLRALIDLLPGDLPAVHAFVLDTPVSQLRPPRVDFRLGALEQAVRPTGLASLIPARWHPDLRINRTGS